MGKRAKVSFDLNRALGDGETLQRQAEQVEDVERRRQRNTVPLLDIGLRTGANTRGLHLPHVLSLAESFTVVGLLQPIVVDRNLRLLAGGHRLAASIFLAVAAEALPSERLTAQPFPGVASERLLEAVAQFQSTMGMDPLRHAWRVHFADGIPIRQMAIDSSHIDDVAIARAVEAIENTQRKNYSRTEVLAIADQFREQGYVETTGRPRTGEKALAPALTVVFGISYATVRRYLDRKHDTVPARRTGVGGPPSLTLDQVLAWLERANADEIRAVQAACGAAASMAATAP